MKILSTPIEALAWFENAFRLAAMAFAGKV